MRTESKILLNPGFAFIPNTRLVADRLCRCGKNHETQLCSRACSAIANSRLDFSLTKNKDVIPAALRLALLLSNSSDSLISV